MFAHGSPAAAGDEQHDLAAAPQQRRQSKAAPAPMQEPGESVSQIRGTAEDTTAGASVPTRRPLPTLRMAAPHRSSGPRWLPAFKQTLTTLTDSNLLLGRPTTWVQPSCIGVQAPYKAAEHHLLVVSRDQGLHGLKSLQKAHLGQLKDMRTLGRHMAATLAPTQTMRQGFVPDAFMDRLHLHIISTDIGSLGSDVAFDCLDFLVPARAVQQALQGDDRLLAEFQLNAPLQCRICGQECSSKRGMKEHVAVHRTG